MTRRLRGSTPPPSRRRARGGGRLPEGRRSIRTTAPTASELITVRLATTPAPVVGRPDSTEPHVSRSRAEYLMGKSRRPIVSLLSAGAILLANPGIGRTQILGDLLGGSSTCTSSSSDCAIGSFSAPFAEPTIDGIST